MDALDFMGLASECGPLVHPVTTSAIVKAESGFNPFAIRNITLSKSYSPRTKQEAENLVATFTARGDRLAIGLMQVTTPWFKRFGIEAETLLNACTNIQYGTRILAANYQECYPKTGAPQAALECALSAYWSGNGSTGGVYVNKVYAGAGSSNRMAVTPGVSDGLLGVAGAYGAGHPIIPQMTFTPLDGSAYEFDTYSTDGFTPNIPADQ